MWAVCLGGQSVGKVVFKSVQAKNHTAQNQKITDNHTDPPFLQKHLFILCGHSCHARSEVCRKLYSYDLEVIADDVKSTIASGLFVLKTEVTHAANEGE